MFVPRRLDKYLRDATALSVVEIRKACLTDRVTVAPAGTLSPLPTLPETLIFENDVVTLDGLVVTPRTQHHYLVLYKPRFVTATARDPDGRTDLGPWLRQMPPGAFPVGRLDRDTSGALLFTNDGDFANAILQPGHHTEKLYWLWLDETIADDDPRLKAFVEGVPQPEGCEPLRATSATIQRQTLDYTELHVTLDEGKNRHIRKMCNLLGLRLLQLHRKAIGTFHLGQLGVGQWRHLDPQEVEQLWTSSGGTARVTQTKIAALAQMARNSVLPNARLEAWLQQQARLPRIGMWLLPLAVGLGLSLSPTLARADGRFVLPPQCGTQGEFEAAVRARLDREASGLLERTQLRIEATPTGYSLTVNVGTQSRTLLDRSCPDLFRASVVVALALWESPAKTHAPPPSIPGLEPQENVPVPTVVAPASTASPTTPSPTRPAASPPAITDRTYPVQGPPRTQVPELRRASGVSLGALLGVISGLTPEASLAVDVFAAYDAPHFTFTGSASYLPATDTRDALGKGVRIYGIGGELCAYYKPHASLGIGAGLGIDRLTGTGLGSESNQSASVVVVAPHVGLWVTPFNRGPFYTRLGAEAQFELWRPRFEIVEYKEVFRSSGVPVQGYFGAGYRFR